MYLIGFGEIGLARLSLPATIGYIRYRERAARDKREHLMTNPENVAAPTSTALDDPFFATVLLNPVARAAFEDAHSRNNFVDALVKLRRAMGLTQTEVANRMGVKQPTVSGFENEGSDPRLSTIQRYARALEATATFRLTMPAHCDWIPRTDSYTAVHPESLMPVKSAPPTDLATSWVLHRRSDFARAA